MTYLVSIANNGSQAYSFSSNGSPARGTISAGQTQPITSNSPLITVNLGSTTQTPDDSTSSGDPITVKLINQTTSSIYFSVTSDGTPTPKKGTIAANKGVNITTQTNAMVSVSNTSASEEA